MNTRNRVLLTAAVVGVIGVLIAVGTSALFSTSTVANGNVAATGTLAATDAGVAFNSGTSNKMKPIASLVLARTQNVVASGTATINNTGDLTGEFSMAQSAVTGDLPTPLNGRPGLDAVLNLCVSDVTSNPANNDCAVYSGDFNMGATIVALGTIAPSASKSYRFEVWMEEAKNAVITDNAYQNKQATADFTFSAV